MPDTFLNLDVEFWSADYRRYTVFLDPGRVKRGILPNEIFGRALVAGRRYTISVDAAWRDANGKPLEAPFTHVLHGGTARPHAYQAHRLAHHAAAVRHARRRS